MERKLPEENETTKLHSLVENARYFLRTRGEPYFPEMTSLQVLKQIISRKKHSFRAIQRYDISKLKDKNIELIISSKYNWRPLIDISVFEITDDYTYSQNSSNIIVSAKRQRSKKINRTQELRIVIPSYNINPYNIDLYTWGSNKPIMYGDRKSLQIGKLDADKIIDIVNLIANEIKRQDEYNKINGR